MNDKPTSAPAPRRRWLGAVAGLGVAAAAGVAGWHWLAPAPVWAGYRMPDLDGSEHDFADWRGEPVLLNFWATWCPPCVHEMPDLERLHAEHPGVRFVGIGIDSLANMQGFLQKVPVSYLLLQGRPEGMALMRELGNAAGGLPYTVLIGRDGQVREALAGRIDPARLGQALGSLAA